MKRPLLVAAVVAVLASIPLLVAFALVPGHRELAFDAYLLFVGAVALTTLVYLTHASLPGADRFDPPGRRNQTTPARLPELARVERAVGLGVANAFDLHSRLRPILREIAGHRLAAGHGVDLDRDEEAAQDLLSDEAWELVRPDREPPEHRFARGLTPAQLLRVVDDIERI